MEVFAFPDYSTFVSERCTSGFVGCVFQYENITLAGRVHIQSQVPSKQDFWQVTENKSVLQAIRRFFIARVLHFYRRGHICTLAHLLDRMVTGHPKKPSCAMRSWRRMELNKRKSQFSVSGDREV